MVKIDQDWEEFTDRMKEFIQSNKGPETKPREIQNSMDKKR